MTTNTQRIEALEAQVKALTTDLADAKAACQAFYTTLDQARTAFVELRAQLKQQQAAKPAAKTSTSTSIPRHEFMAALAELRSDAGDDTALFAVNEIKERVHARRTLAANTAAAAH